jgi:hypothetical protein
MCEVDDPLFPWTTSGLLIRDSGVQMTPSPPLLQMPNKANGLEADHPAWIFEVTGYQTRELEISPELYFPSL